MSRIDPCNIVLFTACPKMSSACIEQFMKARLRANVNGVDLYEEAFRWD